MDRVVLGPQRRLALRAGAAAAHILGVIPQTPVGRFVSFVQSCNKVRGKSAKKCLFSSPPPRTASRSLHCGLRPVQRSGCPLIVLITNDLIQSLTGADEEWRCEDDCSEDPLPVIARPQYGAHASRCVPAVTARLVHNPGPGGLQGTLRGSPPPPKTKTVSLLLKGHLSEWGVSPQYTFFFFL